MTVEEIQAETAKLPAAERLQLLRTLQTDREVKEAWLKAEITEAVEEMERGEYIECRNEEELHAFFEDIKARGLERLAARTKAAA